MENVLMTQQKLSLIQKLVHMYQPQPKKQSLMQLHLIIQFVLVSMFQVDFNCTKMVFMNQTVLMPIKMQIMQ